MKDDCFKLAVVGEFSSGKSTFLNALLGKDILKHGAMETTATITEIHNQETAEEDVFDVYYEDGKIVTNIPIKELIDYTSTNSKIHQVAQEVNKVVIKSNVISCNQKVCFVDTPGLNGVADNHREKTIEQIKNAHACIYLMQVRGLGESDISFLRFIKKYQKNIIFVQNFIDELKELEGETVEEKLKQQAKILSEKVFNDNNDVNYKLVGTSARKALISRDVNFDSYNGNSLTESIRDQLYEESRFDDVISEIINLMEVSEKDNVKQKDAARVALVLLEQLAEILSLRNDKELEILNNSPEEKRKKGYIRIKEELEKNKNMYFANMSIYVVSETTDIRKNIKSKISVGIESGQEEVFKIIDPIKNYIGFDELVKSNLLANILYEQISSLEDSCNEYMQLSFQNLICNAVLRIKQYTGSSSEKVNLGSYELDKALINNNRIDLSKEEQEIDTLKNQIISEEIKFNNKKEQHENMKKESVQMKVKIVQNESKISQIDKKKKDDINRLGKKPEIETKRRTEVSYEYRGGLGILDWMFGPKKVTRSVTYQDDTLQRKWISDKSAIETKYKLQENSIVGENRALCVKLQEIESKISSMDILEESYRQKLETMKNVLESKIHNITVKREKAEYEYVLGLKQSLKESIKVYLSVNAKESLYESFENAINVNRAKVLKLTHNMLEISFSERLYVLSELIGGSNKENGIRTMSKQLLVIVEEAMEKLEGFIC